MPFPRAVARLLRSALEVAKRRGRMHPHGVAVARGRIEAALDRLLRYHLSDPDDERLAAHLFQDPHHLFTFLEEEAGSPRTTWPSGNCGRR